MLPFTAEAAQIREPAQGCDHFGSRGGAVGCHSAVNHHVQHRQQPLVVRLGGGLVHLFGTVLRGCLAACERTVVDRVLLDAHL